MGRDGVAGVTELGSNVFTGCDALSAIYAPNGDIYKEASSWSAYWKLIKTEGSEERDDDERLVK
jgi:hypothetical protein